MAREPQRHLESDLAYERRVFGRPADYVSSYGYRDELPGLADCERRRGLYWRWNTSDIAIGDGHGIMACYLARLPLWQRLKRRISDLIDRWFESQGVGPVRRTRPEPVAEPEEFRYPPGLDLSAFWFRLDFSGPSNPRDPGFEWAWEKPLLPVEEVQRLYGHVEQPQLRRPAPPAPQPGYSKPDPLWDEFMASEFVDYEEFKLWKAGKTLSPRERLQAFDDRYERPYCKACGRSHPSLETPLKKTGDSWAYKDSFYKCNGCGRKWQTKALKAALRGEPAHDGLKLKPRHSPVPEMVPTQLLRPPRMDK